MNGYRGFSDDPNDWLTLNSFKDISVRKIDLNKIINESKKLSKLDSAKDDSVRKIDLNKIIEDFYKKNKEK